MKRGKQSFLIVLILLVTITVSGWLAHSSEMADPDIYLVLKRNITLFQRVYEEILLRYVDEIDPDAFVRAAIYGMTQRLDPYTSLIEKEENQRLQTLTRGKYGGVGMTISKRGDYPVVEEPPFDGTPAAKAGIREGDQIIEVDGVSTRDLSLSEVANRLRGKPGTPVSIKIRRAGEERPLHFRLIRDVIVIRDVSYAGFLEEGIGYIRLTRFSKFSPKQVKEAVLSLKSQGLKGLILDLRSNPGGLLDAAIEIVNFFVPKGELIVYTKGRTKHANRKYYATKDPILPETPLVVLVNGASASASEIVAGAIQDLDRGLVIGSRTYGKGLVQTLIPFPFQKNTALRLTTAKYYIPSGRLIQDVSRLNRDEKLFAVKDEELAPDSSNGQKEFRTKGGRIVYGGGGIKPDIEIDFPKMSNFERALFQQSMFFNFAVNYAARIKDKPEHIEITDEILNEFRQYLTENGFDFHIEGEEEIRSLAEIAREREFGPAVEDEIANLQKTLEEMKKREFDRHVDFIRRYLKREIAAKVLGNKGPVLADKEDDPVLKTAIQVLRNPSEYAMKLGK